MNAASASASASANPGPGPSPARRISLYLLAAPEDRQVCEAITKHLKPIVRDFRMPIDVASDFDAPAGADVATHKQRLLAADIVLVLISADFISNDEVYARVKEVTERHNRGAAVMIPLLVRNCLWKATPFARLDMLPKNFQPLNNMQFWASSDDALTVVVSDIYTALDELATKGQVHIAGHAPQLLPVQSVMSDRSAGQAPPEPPPVFNAAAQTMEIDWRQQYYRNLVLKRGGALMIDWVVCFFLAAVLLAMSGESNDPDAQLGAWFVVFYIFNPLLESSAWQATVGKRVMGLQITDNDGNRIGFWRAAGRNLTRSLVLYAYVLSLGLLLVFQFFRFKQVKKLFHDELSSTVIGERLKRGKAAAAMGSVA